MCSGKGLVAKGSKGLLRKCPECGGFFPWVSWKLFLTSTAAPGNGGGWLWLRTAHCGLWADICVCACQVHLS